MEVGCCSARSKKRELFYSRDPVTGAKFITSDGEPFKPTPGAVIVLTLRMGFGHLRIAHAMASWLEDREYYVYDLLAVSTPETKQLTRIEWFYSTMSRVAADSGGPVEWAWDQLLMGGNTSAQCALPDPRPPAPQTQAAHAGRTRTAPATTAFQRPPARQTGQSPCPGVCVGPSFVTSRWR